MNMYNFKHHTLTLVYYISIVVRGLLLLVFTPLSWVFATVESTLSEWEPSKPLHTSKGDDIDYDEHLGI